MWSWNKALAGLTGALALGLAAPGAAAASTVIDFESLLASTTAYSTQGVTFTSGVGGLVNPVNGPNGSRNIIGNYVEDPNDPDIGVFDPLRADFDALVGNVSVDLGDWPSREYGDEDLLFLEAFDAGDVSLGRVELLIGPLESEFKTLAVAAAGIKYVTFGSVGDGGSSVYADNFTFGAAVPEPSAWVLMILGFGGLGAVLRQRRPAPVEILRG